MSITHGPINRTQSMDDLPCASDNRGASSRITRLLEVIAEEERQIARLEDLVELLQGKLRLANQGNVLISGSGEIGGCFGGSGIKEQS